ncbi:hypothetical protein ABG768_021631 [Culter alburnus]|uniref:Envelope protein n=1 Tax=Culter alburnus TaxID=194366 RepID=A0AAW2ARS2_CULAL
MTWMGNDGAGRGGVNEGVQKATMKCHVNKACTLALLQKEELEINTSCWLCLQMTHAWEAAPLTVDTMKDTTCLIPLQMTEVLRAAADIDKGRVQTRVPARVCIVKYVHAKPDVPIPPLRVTHRQGDVCVCQKEYTHGWTVSAGRSDCRVRIDVGEGKRDICTATISGMTRNFTCPFSRLKDTSPAAVWVCGDKAYHYMPRGSLTGCCYSALMNVGTFVYLPHGESTQKGRKKRGVNIMPATLPEHYQGYVLSDPWTSPGATFRWSLLMGVGMAVSINKINGLAWTVLAIANGTEIALTMVNDEMKQIRSAVIQNRLVLDLLTAEKGGVCKMLGTSCCFHIPDFSDNITDIVVHMEEAVKEPERADNKWMSWFNPLWGGGMAAGLKLIMCLPCIYKCISLAVGRLVMSHQMLKLPVYTDDMFLEWTERAIDVNGNAPGETSG